MDLISVKRKYRNRRNIIIWTFLIVLIILLVIIKIEINKRNLTEKIYIAYLEQGEQAEINQKIIDEQIRKSRLPELTDVGENNIENIYRSETKRVFLTFDDGPSKGVTIPILDILKREKIKATFFVLGSRVELNPDIVKRAYKEGHFIASHGYSHIYSQIYASPQSVLDEYNKSLEIIRNAIGEQEYNPHLFRYPGGFTGGKYFKIKQEAEVLLEQNGILHVDWNSLTADSAGNETIEEFVAELEKTVPKYNSVVVLMHDAGNKIITAEALPQIISYFRERGFEFENFYSIIK